MSVPRAENLRYLRLRALSRGKLGRAMATPTFDALAQMFEGEIDHWRSEKRQGLGET